MTHQGSSETPKVSIVIPIYNEEAILHDAVVGVIDRLSSFDWTYEIILAENGSKDATVALAKELSERYPNVVSTFSASEPDYGLALREGIYRARGQFIICDEIDLCDADFYARAMPILFSGQADFVVGSKAMPGADDERPAFRRLATHVINGMLRVTLDFHGTDTHGLKAFRREPVLPIAKSCVVNRDLFASELVIRSMRAGVKVVEIPVRVLEKRPPSIGLVRRVPNVLKGLARLVWAIRIKG